MRLIAALLLAAALAAAPPAGRKSVIHIPVWVQAESQQEASISSEDLRVKIGGHPAKPVGILGPKDDLMLIVVTDLTGDIAVAEIAKRALDRRIDQLPANSMVGLFSAQDGLRVLVDATLERAPVKAAIDSVPVSGKAGLLETITTTGALGDAILAKASVRLAVLFVTDSDVGNYREDFTNPTINWSDSSDISRRFRDGLIRERISKLDAALAELDTPVFIVHLAYRTDTLNQAYQTGLMTLAATTGGGSYFCRSQTEVSDTIDKVFDSIASHHSVRAELPGVKAGPQDIVLESPGRSLTWRGRITIKR